MKYTLQPIQGMINDQRNCYFKNELQSKTSANSNVIKPRRGVRHRSKNGSHTFSTLLCND